MAGCKGGQESGISDVEPALEPLRTAARAPPSGQPTAPPPQVASTQNPGAQRRPLPTGRGCMQGMARAGGFCIDRFEIRLVDKSTGSQYPYFQPPPRDMSGLKAVSERWVMPQGYMSQLAARAACEAAGKRLCTLEEWRAACQGARKARFPYGEDYEPGRCNVNVATPYILDKYFPDIPHLKRSGKQFNDPRLLIDPDYLQWTGQSAECSTPDGLFDMDGNLSEWVEDRVQKADGMHGTFAGNAFVGYASMGCTRWTDAHAEGYHDYSLGTRCCANPR